MVHVAERHAFSRYFLARRALHSHSFKTTPYYQNIDVTKTRFERSSYFLVAGAPHAWWVALPVHYTDLLLHRVTTRLYLPKLKLLPLPYSILPPPSKQQCVSASPSTSARLASRPVSVLRCLEGVLGNMSLS